MATDLENLQARRTAIYAELAAMSSSTAGGLPNSLAPTGVDHDKYKRGLYDELKALDELEASLTDDGPWEETSEAMAG